MNWIAHNWRRNTRQQDLTGVSSAKRKVHFYVLNTFRMCVCNISILCFRQTDSIVAAWRWTSLLVSKHQYGQIYFLFWKRSFCSFPSIQNQRLALFVVSTAWWSRSTTSCISFSCRSSCESSYDFFFFLAWEYPSEDIETDNLSRCQSRWSRSRKKKQQYKIREKIRY